MTVDDPIAKDAVPKALTYGLILQGPESTVCAEAPVSPAADGAYQSEAMLEQELIDILVSQGYERLNVNSEAALVANLRAKIEELNGIRFTDAEWKRFSSENITNPALTVTDKTRRIQDDPVIAFQRDDGSYKNVYLIDRDHIHKNRLQVMNQYEANEGAHKNRYDVTILVNGLPLVHIELKRRGVRLREAFNQIERYQRESFWSGSGLFEFVQVFAISNGTSTKYYGNTVRWDHTHPKAGRKGASSFEFTSWWTDSKNRRIADLEGFARTFLLRGTLLMVLTHYCVLTAEDEPKLLVMRPYQICATERILNRILVSELDRRRLGTIDAGGYVWHTTGSGKTLTSFKCAQLASRMEGVDKVMFVVDRKDLDYQTMKEYNRFQKDAVNGSADTRALDANLRDDTKRICVTTIQKLSVLIEKSAKHPIYDRHVVFIFDECHRSQFGKMHKDIVKKFKNYHLFGFTGTPIFAKNASMSGDPTLRTTEQAFGDRLHSYTIVNAIDDGNVLPFRVSYLSTMKSAHGDDGQQVEAIDREGALTSFARIINNAEYIIDHYAQHTKRKSDGTGFTSILATESIPAAKRYYAALKQIQQTRAERGELKGKPLKIAMIYSYAPNGDDLATGIIADESMETAQLDASDREALEAAIEDYNAMFDMSFSTDGAKFQSYYKDVSQRLKKRELDMLIVVDMFLTGFDSPTLNTLWVDKNLKMHGLLQAFSRTNRILDSVKSFGNIVCFRDLSHQVDDALELFGDEAAGGIVVLKSYAEYMSDYLSTLDEIQTRFIGADGKLELVGETAEKAFVGAFGALLRLRNVLSVFDDFAADDPLSALKLQDWQSTYLDLADEYRRRAKADAVDIVDDLVFEIELIRQVEVDIDYILGLVAKARGGNGEDKIALDKIYRAIWTSPQLRDKAELIEAFLEHMGLAGGHAAEVEGGTEEERRAHVDAEWAAHVDREMTRELDSIVAEENLDPEKVRDVISYAFEAGGVPESGTMVQACLPKMSRFAKGNAYSEKRSRVIARLQDFYDKFRTLVRRWPVER